MISNDMNLRPEDHTPWTFNKETKRHERTYRRMFLTIETNPEKTVINDDEYRREWWVTIYHQGRLYSRVSVEGRFYQLKDKAEVMVDRILEQFWSWIPSTCTSCCCE